MSVMNWESSGITEHKSRQGNSFVNDSLIEFATEEFYRLCFRHAVMEAFKGKHVDCYVFYQTTSIPACQLCDLEKRSGHSTETTNKRENNEL